MSKKSSKKNTWLFDLLLLLIILLLFLVTLFIWASFWGIPIGKYIITTDLKTHTLVFTRREDNFIYRCPSLTPCILNDNNIDCPEVSSFTNDSPLSITNSELNSSIDNYIPSMPSGISYDSLMPSYYTLAYYNNSPDTNLTLVEILSDKQNGNSYNILLPTGETKWVSPNDLISFTSNRPILSKLSPTDKNMLIQTINISSPSEYLLWVDLARLEVNVFKGTPNKHNWILQEVFPCSAGALKTPTKRGLFSIQDRGLEFKDDYTYMNWLRYDGSYLLHSVPYLNDTNLPKNIIHPIQNRDSNGCITLSLEHSKWLYDNIPSGTTIFVN